VVVGAFVLGAVALAIAAVLLWGSRSVFEKKSAYVCYFPGAVNGLTKGAPVKYRGVEIGAVKEVRIRFHQAPGDTRIPVLIEVWEKRLRELGTDGGPTPQRLPELIGRGLRARLETQSVVTGVLYVSLDYFPGSTVVMSELPNDEGIAEIPTLPTDLEEASKAVSQLLDNLKHLDAKGAAEAITKAATAIGDLVRDPELKAAIDRLPSLVLAAKELVVGLNGSATQTLATARTTLEGASGALAPQGPLAVDLTRTLNSVDKAATAVRDLADFLRRNPHAIIAGTKESEEKK
jgi:paraquat-inducible protein B